MLHFQLESDPETEGWRGETEILETGNFGKRLDRDETW